MNTSLKCRNVGCRAEAVLQPFLPSTEEAVNCMLDLHIHPTDFDDEYSGERLTSIRINGMHLNEDCFPLRNGCNKKVEHPMFACVQAYPVDKLINHDGFLKVEAQISEVVDECPYDGNLLSGVPTVTCMVRPKIQRHHGHPVYPVRDHGIGGNGAGGSGYMDDSDIVDGLGGIVNIDGDKKVDGTGSNSCRIKNGFADKRMQFCLPIDCSQRGCNAHVDVRVNTKAIMFYDLQCHMNIHVYETDFDADPSSLERIEYVKINGKKVPFNQPKRNPCKAKNEGEALKQSDLVHNLVTNKNVNELIVNGGFSLDVKITPYVDECAHNGNLLDGVVAVFCSGLRGLVK